MHRHAAQEAPVRPHNALEPLQGHPAPGDVLRAAAAALPTTDPRGYLQALAAAYDTAGDTTIDRLIAAVSTDRGWPEQYTRLALGVSPRKDPT